MTGEFIVRRGQRLPDAAVLGLGDHSLGVLDAHPNGKGLGGEGDPAVVEHLKGVPGRMAGGQNQRIAHLFICALRANGGETGQSTAAYRQAGQPVAKADLTAQGEQFLADVLDHLAQNIGADMGFVLPADILGRSGGGQNVQHGRHPGVMDAGGQLAVGEGARATLTELNIGFGVQCAA